MKTGFFGHRKERETIVRLEHEVVTLREKNVALTAERNRLKEENAKLDQRRKRTKEAYREMVTRWREAEVRLAPLQEKLVAYKKIEDNLIARVHDEANCATIWHRLSMADIYVTNGVAIGWHQASNSHPKQWCAWHVQLYGPEPSSFIYDSPQAAFDAFEDGLDAWD